MTDNTTPTDETEQPVELSDILKPKKPGIIEKTRLGYIFVIQGKRLMTIPLLRDNENIDKMYSTIKEYIPNKSILRLGFYEEIPKALEEIQLEYEKRIYVHHRSEIREYMRYVWGEYIKNELEGKVRLESPPTDQQS